MYILPSDLRVLVGRGSRLMRWKRCLAGVECLETRGIEAVGLYCKFALHGMWMEDSLNGNAISKLEVSLARTRGMQRSTRARLLLADLLPCEDRYGRDRGSGPERAFLDRIALEMETCLCVSRLVHEQE